VEAVARTICGIDPWQTYEFEARAAIALIAEKLETVTPEMRDALEAARPYVEMARKYVIGERSGNDHLVLAAIAKIDAILAASPLSPGKD
jgi:hypothetical protein